MKLLLGWTAILIGVLWFFTSATPSNRTIQRPVSTRDQRPPRAVGMPGETGLLLEPPVDLSRFSRDDFLKFSATVGRDKIGKGWTSGVTALAPHARADVCGLTEPEVKEYMLRVRDLFDRGDSVPVSDVGLISTQEDVIRKPMFNHVAAFSNSTVNVYLLVQTIIGNGGWSYFSIVQDRTTEPPLNYFAEIQGKNIKFEAKSCYQCHSSGALAIHPVRADLVSDARLMQVVNRHIADQPVSRMFFPKNDPPKEYGQPLGLKACAKCHQDDGERAPLFQAHSHSIRVLVDFGYMPPKRELDAGELAELKTWLNRKP